MGLFDFLSGSSKGSNVKRLVAKATNKHAQSVDRFKALEDLAENRTDEAIAGLLRRFTFVYDKTIEDEQEKEWVHDQLVEMAGGDPELKARVLAALEHALVHSGTIAWPLKVLHHVASHDEAWPILEKVIAANDNEYVRDPSRKIQLIDFLGEWPDPRVVHVLLPWFEDMSEDVRFRAVEAILAQKNEEVGREPLLKLAVKPDEESRRIKIRILDGLHELGWNVHGYKGQVDELCQTLASGHSIDGKGRIRRGRS